MKNCIKINQKRQYSIHVLSKDFAKFESGLVHEVYSTFALCRDAEWSGRLFVIDMLEEGEEGIGTFISVNHISPAFEGDEVCFVSTFVEINKNEITTLYEAKVRDRLIAHGMQKQKIVLKSKMKEYINQLKK